MLAHTQSSSAARNLSLVPTSQPSTTGPSADLRSLVPHRLEEGPSLARDASDLLGVLGLYCDLLEAPGVLSLHHHHYASELRLIYERSGALMGRLLHLPPDHFDRPKQPLERDAERRAIHVEPRPLPDALSAGPGVGDLIGRSPAMEKLYRILSKVACTTHPVLILGESGTGKELVARTIHAHGPNAGKPFFTIDCGSQVPSLIESELFGYAKGAFAGLNRARTSLLAAAEGGTVLLNEVGELPLDLQARLLRALQEKEVRPIGSNHGVPINARILAATDRDLAAMVETGQFRKDLFFRLNVVNLRIPPLRERKADVPLLAAYALERAYRDSGLSCTLSDDALRLLMDYDWPGNVRELEHAIERACALSSGPVLHMADFPAQMQDQQQARQGARREAFSPSATVASPAHVLTIAELEKNAILNTIQQLKGDKLMAARLLGIGKTTLYRKLKEYGIGEA